MTHDCSFLVDVLDDGQIAFGEHAREEHAADWGGERAGMGVRPDAVVWPESTADVAAVLAAADERDVPVTPYAAGTALEGHAVPVERGISMDLTRMNAILDVRPGDFQVDVEPGILGSEVDEAVAGHGLFFPPLPSSGSVSTIGGMIATDASGMQTVKYGEVADWVLELEAVLADGTVITTGSKAAKTSSGYNLLDLLVGSEGTLAVVTRATLELAGRPEQIRGGRAIFDSIDDAAAAVADAVQSGVDVAKIELLDELTATMTNAYLGADLPDAPMVFLEFHANHGIEDEITFCETVFDAHDPVRFEMAGDERMADLWEAREELAFAVQEWDEDFQPLHPGDVTVPISRYPEIVEFVKERAVEAGLDVTAFGHAGDGNLHYDVMVDPDDGAMVERGEAVYRDIVERAIELGGTATGEHGIGLGKRHYLEPEHGEAAVDLMRGVKETFDPNGTLNPGKIFPDE